MERLQERLGNANRALIAFREVVVNDNPSAIERDAAIQRFEFSFEACWKTGRQFLFDVEGLDIGSPKGVIRSFREVGVFSEDETILSLQMTDDRNLTVHTYNEALAMEIYAKLPKYYSLLCDWIARLERKIR
ncbi:nucleotidyltransferase [Lentibacillus kapialis]|uniref:Nucleotidyltransferase n=1 Tax=Lentibacillus kapialis TaxID=340214 RepID=A0A917PT72_9BACI|nr:HI0074 family nucleotidyltransferase substrate-binding subunit [Lentibacillus kapialis]GGJ90359.1 nucleotidyltransferase [Lentibacillus kapialis]